MFGVDQRSWVLGLGGLLLALSLAACGGSDDDGDGGGNGNGVTTPAFTGVRGTVRALDGAPLGGVQVEAGLASAQTGFDGAFSLEVAAGDAVLRLSRDGYLPTTKRVAVVDGKPTGLEVTMMAVAAPLTLDATVGGEVLASRGAALVAGASAFVDSNGDPVTGDVDVRLTPLDPSVAEELAAFPGDLRAEQADGAAAQLISWGVVDVQVSQGTERLQVKPGETVTLHIPTPAGADSPPETMPIWSFDEETGIWKEEGVGTYDADKGVYVAEIGHFSYWNADEPMEATCLRGAVTDASGAPVAGAHVRASGVDYLGMSDASADAQGRFCVVVRKDSQVRLTASDGRGRVVQREVASGSAATTIPPACGACTDVGALQLSDAPTCGELGNPFAGTCAADMGDIFSCFAPEGACTMSPSLTGPSVIRYANGARIESELVGTPTNPTGAEQRLYGANGDLCGTIAFDDIGGDDETVTYTVTSPAGTSWEVVQETGGGMTVTCPGGESFGLTGAQLDAYAACTGGSQQDEECAVEGLDGGGGGGFPEGCTSNADCDSPTVCCEVMEGYSFCTLREVCDAVQADMGQ